MGAGFTGQHGFGKRKPECPSCFPEKVGPSKEEGLCLHSPAWTSLDAIALASCLCTPIMVSQPGGQCWVLSPGSPWWTFSILCCVCLFSWLMEGPSVGRALRGPTQHSSQADVVKCFGNPGWGKVRQVERGCNLESHVHLKVAPLCDFRLFMQLLFYPGGGRQGTFFVAVGHIAWE